MPLTPLRYNPGDQFTSSWLNALMQWIRSTRVRNNPQIEVTPSPGGQSIRLVIPQETDFRITGGANPYSGIEQSAAFNGAWGDMPGGRVSTVTIDPLYERGANNAVTVGTIVHTKRDSHSGLWIFDRRACNPATIATPSTPTTPPTKPTGPGPNPAPTPPTNPDPGPTKPTTPSDPPPTPPTKPTIPGTPPPPTDPDPTKPTFPPEPIPPSGPQIPPEPGDPGGGFPSGPGGPPSGPITPPAGGGGIFDADAIPIGYPMTYPRSSPLPWPLANPLPMGSIAFPSAHHGVNAIQTIAAAGIYITTQFWSVSYGVHTSATIQYGDNAATVKAALEAITGIGSGNLSVTGNAGTGSVAMSWAVEFVGALAAQSVTAFTMFLTSAGTSITITQTQIGSP